MIRHSFAKTGILLSLLALSAAPVAAEDVMSIKSGTLVVQDDQNNSLGLSGTQEFKLEGGSVSLASKEYGAIGLCIAGECAPGTVVDLEASWSGGDIFGAVQHRGKFYPCIGCVSADHSLRIGFSGSAVMPPMSDGPVSVTVPFEFAGDFHYGSNNSLITGGGRVTLTLIPHPEGLNSWWIQRMDFAFRRVNKR